MDSSSNSKGCMGQCLAYVRTHKGAILIAEIVVCVLILICYGASRTPGYTSLAVCVLIFCTLHLVIFMCGLHNRITFIHWGWTDFIRALIAAISFFITSLVVLIGHRDGAGITAGVFGLLAGFLFSYDAYSTIRTLTKSHTSAPTDIPSEGI